MSGKDKYLLDTNCIIYFFQGNQEVRELVEHGEILISVISIIEYFSFKGLSYIDRSLFEDFLSEEIVTVVSLSFPQSRDVLSGTIRLRSQSKLKVPDAIVAASAISKNATLVTADKAFAGIEGMKLKLISP